MDAPFPVVDADFPSERLTTSCRARRRLRWYDAMASWRDRHPPTTCSTNSPGSIDADRALITGGATAERAVAFAGAAQIVDALRGAGIPCGSWTTVTGLLLDRRAAAAHDRRGREPPAVPSSTSGASDAVERLAGLKEVTGADVLFLCLHAGRGEGGILQAVLERDRRALYGSGALQRARHGQGPRQSDCSGRRVPVPAWFMPRVRRRGCSRRRWVARHRETVQDGLLRGMTLVRTPKSWTRRSEWRRRTTWKSWRSNSSPDGS